MSEQNSTNVRAAQDDLPRKPIEVFGRYNDRAYWLVQAIDERQGRLCEIPGTRYLVQSELPLDSIKALCARYGRKRVAHWDNTVWGGLRFVKRALWKVMERDLNTGRIWCVISFGFDQKDSAEMLAQRRQQNYPQNHIWVEIGTKDGEDDPEMIPPDGQVYLLGPEPDQKLPLDIQTPPAVWTDDLRMEKFYFMRRAEDLVVEGDLILERVSPAFFRIHKEKGWTLFGFAAFNPERQAEGYEVYQYQVPRSVYVGRVWQDSDRQWNVVLADGSSPNCRWETMKRDYAILFVARNPRLAQTKSEEQTNG